MSQSEPPAAFSLCFGRLFRRKTTAVDDPAGRHPGLAAWKTATATGVLALLMMLGLQTSEFFNRDVAADDGDVAAGEQQAIAKDPPNHDRRKSPDSMQPTAAVERTTAEPVEPQVNGEADDSPFAPDGPFPPEVARKAGKPVIERANDPGDVANESAEAMLELQVFTSEVSEDRFLVTSAGEPERKTGQTPDPATDSAVWTAVRWSNQGSAILPVRYSVPGQDHAAGHARSTSIGGTATASANWTVAGPGLAFQIVGPKRVTVGQSAAIRLLVTNTGSAAAKDIVLHVDLPGELKYFVGRRLLHRVGSLGPGKTHVAKLTATAVRTGTVRVSGRALVGDAAVSAETAVTIERR